MERVLRGLLAPGVYIIITKFAFTEGFSHRVGENGRGERYPALASLFFQTLSYLIPRDLFLVRRSKTTLRPYILNLHE